MTSKTTSTPSLRHGVLHDVAVLAVSGPEAAAFLQRQCMNDVGALAADGASQWTGLLSPKGRVLFLFRLLRQAADRFLLLAPAAEPAVLAGELRRYVLRSKLSVEPQDAALAVAIGEAAPASGGWLAWDVGRWFEPLARPTQGATDLGPEWLSLDTERGLPRVDAGLADRFTPQMLGLARLRAYSLSKGCYPGQEIVARTHYLGQPKRELALLYAERGLHRGETVLCDEQPLGDVLQVAPLRPRYGLAVLPRDAESGLRLADGSAAQRRVLADP